MSPLPQSAPRQTSGAEFTEVRAAERKVIDQQRLNRGIVDAAPLVGLALSGGGIRSASFALGVLQALARSHGTHTNQLRNIDYLSTVSGGGYIGSSLTWFNFLQRDVLPAERRFPFGSKNEAKRQECARTQVAVDNTAFIRQHGEYLTPARIFTSASLIGVLLRNIVVTASVYFALVVALTMAARIAYPYWSHRLPGGWLATVASESMLPAVVAFLIFGLLSIGFGLLTALVPKLAPDNRFLYWCRVHSQRLIGLWLVWSFVALICGTVPHVYQAIVNWTATGFALSTTGAAGVIYEFVKQQRPKLAAKLPKTNLLILWITVFAICYGLLLGAYAISMRMDPLAEDLPLPLYFLAYALLVGGFLNSNMFSLGRMYRDRLMEAFMPDPAAVASRKWHRATQADVTFMQDVCTEKDCGPYHLVNTNIVLTGTDYANYRGRGGDSFVFASQYSGSEATGWHKSDQMCGGSMSLATAMSISGAAVNPNAACGGRGPTRNRLASFVLALFNIRLGYWIRNPNASMAGKILSGLIWPNLIYPGLRQGLLGTGHHMRAGFVELTDGGHFDNTGIYELVRRKVDCIILSLASADPGYGFDDLADVVERVRADFGVFIEFESMMVEAIPGPEGPTALGIAASLKLAKSSHVSGKVSYPDGTVGKIIVLKSALTKDLPVDVVRYASTHVAFPNESTADQFFDERQFEAYREAGYAAAAGMIRERHKELPF
jgi:hypothetical protein